MKSIKSAVWLPLLFTALLMGFFALLFFTDNKYKTPPPYGRDGVLNLTEDDVQNRALFLIDGWLLTDDLLEQRPTYIGQFSSLQRGDKTRSPHGRAVYQIKLHYRGDPVEVMLSFPQLFFRHTITLDEQLLSRGNGGARISFPLTDGEHLLTVETVSAQGYYSGMYHPPVLGTSSVVVWMSLIQCIAYAGACFGTLVLSLFTLVLWQRARDRLAFWFGLLCCFFSLYLSYYFVRLLALPAGEYWHLVQSTAFYGLCVCVIRLAALSGGIACERVAKRIGLVLSAASVLLLMLALLIPILPIAVWIHGILTNLYYIFTFCCVLLLCLQGKPAPGWEGRFIRLACAAFGAGLLINIFAANLFEPILFYWQFEWCGLLLVMLFGAMLAARNKRILAENSRFQTHLEDLVAQRTEELTKLLKERKAFFADMAHDLKTPVYAANSFIQAIREHDTGVDGELLRYLDLVEQKQQEMARRVLGLAAFNQMDELSERYEAVWIQQLLSQVYKAHHMAAEVQSVHFTAEPPNVDGRLYAQPGKLDILFENLIVNALKFTPSGGKITLSAVIDEEGCHLVLADTGCGISSEELPHIFDRFYVGSRNKGSGSGLGLYIVKSIVDSLCGEISVSSTPGQGTVFFVDLPLMEEKAT